MGTKHARLSASGAHRWMTCPGSLALEETLPPSTSSYAEEGTAAHELAERALKAKNPSVDRVYELQGQYAENGYEFTAEMCDFVAVFVNNILDYAEGNYMHVEQRVSFDHVVPGGFGTNDVSILTRDGLELQVHDLKFGRGVQVDAEDNKQLMLYALGALKLHDPEGFVERVRLIIHQPRRFHLSEWEISNQPTIAEIEKEILQIPSPLFNFTIEAKEAAQKAIDIADNGAPPEYKPSEKACKFCRAKAICPALAETALEAVDIRFEDLTQLNIEEVQGRIDENTQRS